MKTQINQKIKVTIFGIKSNLPLEITMKVWEEEIILWGFAIKLFSFRWIYFREKIFFMQHFQGITQPLCLILFCDIYVFSAKTFKFF